MSKKAIKHLSNDLVLKNVIDTIPLEISNETNNDVYGALMRSIISQQLSVKAARTIYGRFLDLFENNYPHPEKITTLDAETMRGVGLSRQKSAYLKNVSAFFVEQNLIEKDWTSEADEEVLRVLTQIKGVGTWTVEMILMFTLNRPDIFPVGDLGIQNAMIGLYGIEAEKKELNSRMIEISNNWRPYRTLACRYLWEWKDR